VRNQGPAPAGPFRVTFYMSATDATPGTGVAIGFRDLAGLAPGTISTASTPLTIPATLTPGSYHVSAVADSTGLVTELSETNNGLTASTAMNVTLYQPDLVVSTLTAPAAGMTGRPITVANSVRNQGPAPTVAFRITFYMSSTDPTPGAGTAIGFRDVAALAAGAVSTASTVLTIPATLAPTSYYLSSVADSGGVVTELDASNNGRTASLQVAVTLFQADLVVTALTAPATAAIGHAIIVTSTVRNQGPAAAGPFRVTLYMSATDATPGAGTAIGFRDVAALAAGGVSTASTVLTIPATYGTGTFNVSAVADTGGVVTELVETNNGLTAPTPMTVTLN